MADTPILNYKGKYDGPEIDKAIELALGLENPESCPYYVHVSLSQPDYVLTIGLGDAEGNLFNRAKIDLPLESMVVNATYENGNIILHLQDGTSTEPIPISALIAGLVSENRTIAGIDLKDDITQKELRDALDVYTKDSVDQLVSDLENRIDETLNDLSDLTSEHDTQIEKNTSDIATNKNAIEINQRTLGTQCKNIFDILSFQNVTKTATRATIENVENGIKITADVVDSLGKKGDTYTNSYDKSNNHYKMPVNPNTKYIISWNADNNNSGRNYVFFNGVTDANKMGDNSSVKEFPFTTPSNATFITVRFGVTEYETSITYTNIMIRSADITDPTYEPYKPSVNDRLVEVEESVSELTPQVEQNKSDILSLENLAPIVRTPKHNISTSGWYRLFTCVKLGTVRSAIITLNRSYAPSKNAECYNVLLTYSHSQPFEFLLLGKSLGTNIIKKLRIVYQVSQNTRDVNPAYIDVQIETDTACNICANLGLQTVDGNVYSNYFVSSDSLDAEIPNGYGYVDIDLSISGGISDRLKALETALSQTQTE